MAKNTPAFQQNGITLFQGEANAALKGMEAETVHTCVTSPPYWGLRDYGTDGQIGLEPTPDEHIAVMVEVFREVRRVLRDDGTLWMNYGDVYMDKQLIGMPWRVALALQADGWWLRQDIIWHKPNPMPESVTDRCTKAHEYIFLLSKAARYYYDADAIREPHGMTSWTAGNDSKGLNSYNVREHARFAQKLYNPLGRNKRSVWKVATKSYKGAHFATFPPKLIEPCIKAGCPENGTVLDPFMGSGTTAKVAQQLGRNCTGIELNPIYLELARERLAQKVLF